jgi:hypothetical protein
MEEEKETAARTRHSDDATRHAEDALRSRPK